MAVIAAISIVGIWGVVGERAVDAFSSGPPSGYSGAPGEDNCAECHTSFAVNSGDGSVTISGLPHDYLPGQQVVLHVTTADKAATLFGFQMTAVDRNGATLGTFTLPQSPNPPTQLVEGTIGSGDRVYVEHTSAGLFTPNTFGSNTWTFTWTAPAMRGGKVSFYVAGNAANSDGGTSGDYIYTSTTSTLSGSAIANFDGDFASDIAVFRPRTGTWLSRTLDDPTIQTISLGMAKDIAVPGDYDGDGKTDAAVFRPSTNEFHILRSTAGLVVIPLGVTGDIPVAGDYEGDGKTDAAVFHPANGAWTINKSTGGTMTATLGQPGDKPVAADYDGDAKTDVAVYRPSNGTWYLQRSTAGSTTIAFGNANDRPVQADYDGDGKADVGYFRPSNATWYIIGSTDGSIVQAFGFSQDTPAPADYDGDGKADLAVFRAGKRDTGLTWHVRKSSDSGLVDIALGQARDVPVAAGYIPQ